MLTPGNGQSDPQPSARPEVVWEWYRGAGREHPGA
jgi:hypothetical protein